MTERTWPSGRDQSVSADGGPIRGRVIARDGDEIVVRTAGDDVRVRHAGAARPGDLVELAAPDAPLRRVRAFTGGDYPTAAHEVSRLGGGRRGRLAGRGRLMAALREFFAGRDFLEVDTPLLVPSPGLEVHRVVWGDINRDINS